MLILLLSVSFLAVAAPLPPAYEATASTTPEVTACLTREADTADGELLRYETAARAKLIDLRLGDTPDRPDHQGMLEAFDRGESLWREARDASCQAVHDSYVPGTIAPSMGLACRIRRTRLQTHAVWSDFLTYPDGTPPLLPEPPVGPGG